MTATSHNETDRATLPSPEDRSIVVVHTPWAGWYYEASAQDNAVAAA